MDGLKPLVVVVEDGRGDAEVIVQTLASSGVEFLLARDAHEARDLLEEMAAHAVQPCLFLVDALIPGCEARDFLTDDLADPPWNRVPVVVVTSVEGPAIFESFYEWPWVRAILRKGPSLASDVTAAVDFWKRVPRR